jgi:hypothetical protein
MPYNFNCLFAEEVATICEIRGPASVVVTANQMVLVSSFIDNTISKVVTKGIHFHYFYYYFSF